MKIISMAIFAGAIAYVALSRNGARTAHGPAAMPLNEAYLILGLSPGARRDEVFVAYRNLIKRLHPDQGGTNYLASRVNEAKDVLLKHVKI
jgi:DnaJ-class molecular chaperone